MANRSEEGNTGLFSGTLADLLVAMNLRFLSLLCVVGSALAGERVKLPLELGTVETPGATRDPDTREDADQSPTAGG